MLSSIALHIFTYFQILSHICHLLSHIFKYCHIYATYCHIFSNIVTCFHTFLNIVTYKPPIVTYCHILSHIVTYCHKFSQIFTYFHIFSHIFTYFQILSHMFTHFQILSRILTYFRHKFSALFWTVTTIYLLEDSMQQNFFNLLMPTLSQKEIFFFYQIYHPLLMRDSISQPVCLQSPLCRRRRYHRIPTFQGCQLVHIFAYPKNSASF
jgi:hypothetical protein